ncbi:unnamed protein product, partial [Amoebophrya sp. A25]|eukprot:GSA25T00023615001.1
MRPSGVTSSSNTASPKLGYRPTGFEPLYLGEKRYVARLADGVEIPVDAEQARQ